jgi:hypothetical protein
MQRFDRFVRVTTAAVGAIVLSSISVAAAIGPAHPVGAHPTQIAAVGVGTGVYV